MTISKLRSGACERFRQKNEKKRILVGALYDGATSPKNDITEVLREELAKRGIDADVIGNAGFGWNEIEPVVTVFKPEKPALVFGNVTVVTAKAIVADYIIGGDSRPDLAIGKIGDGDFYGLQDFFGLPFFALQNRVALCRIGLTNPADLDNYIAVEGFSGLERAFALSAEEVIERATASEAEKAKLKRYHEADSAEKIVVCNAANRDMDDKCARLLLEGDPYAALEGLIIAGYAIGANKGYMLVNGDSTAALCSVGLAVSRLREAGLLGSDIMGSGFSFDIEIKRCGGEIINREETAAISVLSGGLPMPFFADAPVLDINGIPAYVEGVETLAKLPAALTADGGERARTRVISVVGDLKITGVVEASDDTTLADLVFSACGGEAERIKAVCAGGVTGMFFPSGGLDVSIGDIPWNAGVVRAYGNERCVVRETAEILRLATLESCGKCVSCREGTYQLSRILADMTEGKAKAGDIELIKEICSVMEAVALCGYGKAAAETALTSLKHFGDEYNAHINRKVCPALVCKKYVTFHILGEKCAGCGKCAEICPSGAILGEEGYIHVIDPYDCVKCGKCIEICPKEYSAVVKAGLVKPRTPEEPVPVGSWRRR